MANDVDRFIESFGTMVRLAQEAQMGSAKGREFIEALEGHLGAPPGTVPLVVEDVPNSRFVDADIILESLAGPDARLVGIGGGDQRHHLSLSDVIQQAEAYATFPLSQPDYANLAVGPEAQRQVLAFGLRLFRYHDAPVALLQRKAEPRYGRQAGSVEVLCADAAVTAALLAEFRRRMQGESVLKGQVLSFVHEDFGPSSAGVTFHHRPVVTDEDVVLPEGLLDRVRHHALGIAAHRDALVAAGQHLKRGILLYGPPGTGKTHTVRFLLSQSAGTTAILLSGGTLAHVAEAARMARALQPSIVVLEDCDLIAEDRSMGHGPQPLLFEVLDAMDGLDADADVTFVLTTNRVDMLERALAQRPGRVDLAVEVPLPAEHERAALLRLYSRGLPFSDEAVGTAAGRTEGTTASFTRELVRRAVLAAALLEESPADRHLLGAVDELMSDGAALTRSLLGSGGGSGGGSDEQAAGPVPGSVTRYEGSYSPAYRSSLSIAFDAPGSVGTSEAPMSVGPTLTDGGYSEDGFPGEGVDVVEPPGAAGDDDPHPGAR